MYKLIISFILTFLSVNIFAQNPTVEKLENGLCKASGQKVVNSMYNYLVIGNLYDSMFLVISYDEKKGQYRDIIKKLKNFENDNKTFDIIFKPSSYTGQCSKFYDFENIVSLSENSTFSYNNGTCLSLSQSKAFFSVIDFNDFNEVLKKLNGNVIDETKMGFIKDNLTMIIHNSLKSDPGFATSIFFYSYFLELLYEQGVREITREQLISILSLMNLDLPSKFYERLDLLLGKMDKVVLSKNDNKLNIAFKMSGDQFIPAKMLFDESEEDLKKGIGYFKGINLDKKMRISIKDSDISVFGQYKATIEIQGISGLLDFPIYGEVPVTAKKVVIFSDSDKSNFDLKAGKYIPVSKNLPLNLNFDFNIF